MKINKDLRQQLRAFQFISKCHGKHELSIFDKHNLDLVTKSVLEIIKKGR